MNRLRMSIAALSFLFAASFAHAQSLNDAQIATLLKTANDAEISAAQLAQRRAQNAEVKGFADHMVKDHTQNNKDDSGVEKQIGAATTSSDRSRQLKTDAEAKLDELKKLKGASFDKAYMDLQVNMHQQLLNDLNQTLIPSAQRDELKTYLQDTKSHVEKHLASAKDIQLSLQQ